MSERFPVESPVFRKTLSESSSLLHHLGETSPLYSAYSPPTATRVLSNTLTLEDAENIIRETYVEYFERNRPLTSDDVSFLLVKANPKGSQDIEKIMFQPFFEWYVRILKCFSRSGLWLVPGCIHGFINRTRAKQILQSEPKIDENKVSFD